jgi:hypothetical protein
LKITFIDFLNFVIRANHFNYSTMLKSYKIIYYKSGSGQIMIGTSIFRFKDRMFAIVPPNQIFEDIVISQTEKMICEFIIDSDVEKPPCGLYVDNDYSILKQFEKIRREYCCQKSYRDVFLDLFSAELYYLLLRNSYKSFKKTNSGITKDCIEIAKLAKNSNASTIFITKFAKTPATKYADVLLLSGANEGPMQGGSIAAKTSQMFMVDILFTEYFRRKGDLSIENKKHTAAAIAGKML